MAASVPPLPTQPAVAAPAAPRSEPPASAAAEVPLGPLRRTIGAIGSAVQWCFGLASLIVGLAVLATFPLLQLLSLGYLLESSGRVARTGRLRDGLIGVRTAALVGGIVLALWLLRWPLRLVASLQRSALLIEPHSPADEKLGVLLLVLIVLVSLHSVAALLRGGKLRHFLIPPNPIRLTKALFSRKTWANARDRVCDLIASLRLPYYFWMGLRGLIGGLVWLAVPVSLLVIGSRSTEPGGAVVGLLGGALLGLVVLYLPFLQTHMAAENRLRAVFELGTVRQQFRRAPLSWWFALAVTLLLALPLYLLKVELIPREAAWLPSLVFVLFIFPARLLTGWAVGRARRSDFSSSFLLRWPARLAMLPVAGVYVLLVYLSQYTNWNGALSLWEQHAFLVPVPLLGM